MQLSNPLLMTLATLGGPSRPNFNLGPTPAPQRLSVRRASIEDAPIPQAIKAYTPPALRPRSPPRFSHGVVPVAAPTPCVATPVVPEVKKEATRFRPGAVMTSLGEVVACLRRYEHLSLVIDSEVFPLTPIEPLVRVQASVLELVCFMLRQRLGEDRVRDTGCAKGAPARILLDSGKILLMHPIA